MLVDLILLHGSVTPSMAKNRINFSQQIGYEHIKCEGLNQTGYIDEISYNKKYDIFLSSGKKRGMENNIQSTLKEWLNHAFH